MTDANTPNDSQHAKDKRAPSLIQSLTPLLAMALFLGYGYGALRLPAEVLLIAAAAVAGIIANRLGYNFRELQEGILVSMMKGMPAMLIVIVVGALIGSWIACGTIPMLIFYGLKLISPALFLVTACIVCSVVSVVTVSASWNHQFALCNLQFRPLTPCLRRGRGD